MSNNPLSPSIGFRLVNELQGLLQGVAADLVILPAETDRIRRWLLEADQYRHLQPFKDVSRALDRALDDGVLTLDECEDVLFATQRLTTVNPYFDAIRSGTQELMGWLAGVAADQRIPEIEARKLIAWCSHWSHLQGVWPYDECEALVTSMVSRGQFGAEVTHLLALARQFPIAGDVDERTGELPLPLIGGVCAVDPDLQFDGRRFVFTGESSRGTREHLHGLVRARGGEPWPRVTREVHFLIVCDEGNPCWAFACYGRKVEQAYRLRQQGIPIAIVHEADFWDATQ